MLIKKLAAPLINDKILAQAEHCYIATSGISDLAFQFVTGRLSVKCKTEIVTGLDSPTSPGTLKRILSQLTDRFSLRVYTKNVFHANAYIFDLPFRKSVAFIGSGSFSMEGLKDQEEIFWRTTDPKEIENLKSWFTGYYEFSEILTEKIIFGYELAYPTLKSRQALSRKDKNELMEVATRAFNLDGIRFKTQFFKKEDYSVFASESAGSPSEEFRKARENALAKMLQLHDMLKPVVAGNNLSIDESLLASPTADAELPLVALHLAYGRSVRELERFRSNASPADFANIQMRLRDRDFSVALVIGETNSGKEDREYFRLRMNEPEYRDATMQMLRLLGPGYWIEVAAEKKDAGSIGDPAELHGITMADDFRFYPFLIAKTFRPDDPAIAIDRIQATITAEMEKLIPLYRYMKSPK